MSLLPPYDAILASQNFFSRSMAVGILENEKVLATSMAIPNPHFNTVLDSNLDENSFASTFAQIEYFFDQYHVPWVWLVFPFSKPNSLTNTLSLYGLKEIETFAVMGQDLEHFSPSLSGASYRIEEVKNSYDFDAWCIPLQEGFQSTAEETQQFRTRTEAIPYGNAKPFQHYVLFLDNLPVAAGTISFHQHNARLDNIAVRPAYQKQGIGTALIYHMLMKAKKRGAHYCFLDASNQGMSLYKKLGFEEYYQGQIWSKRSD